MKIGVLLHDVRCISVCRDSFGAVLAPALRELYSDFSFIFIAVYFKTTMSQSVDRLRQLEEIEKVRGIGPIGETFFHVKAWVFYTWHI